MTTLYFECSMGAAGDMLGASLYELLDDKSAFIDKMNSLGIPGVSVSAVPAESRGISGTRLCVSVNGVEEGHEHEHHHEHHHSDIGGIGAIINSLNVSDSVKQNAQAVYSHLAASEAKIHGKPVDLVHFHEVGALDAVADIVGFCVLIEMLGAERIECSPIVTGFGTVKAAHGVLPVPAPATASLLTGIPTRAGDVEGELTTPTGAALLKHFCTAFGNRPDMVVEKVGYGIGYKSFGDRPNCVRAFLGETSLNGDSLCELRCTVDDMTAEAASFAAEQVLSAGARDVYIEQVLMKKGRPGFVFVCLCDSGKAGKLTEQLLMHTTTLGVRRFDCTRISLDRTISEVETPYGTVRIKRSAAPGISRVKAEYEDVAELARRHGISFADAEKLLREYIG